MLALLAVIALLALAAAPFFGTVEEIEEGGGAVGSESAKAELGSTKAGLWSTKAGTRSTAARTTPYMVR